MVTYLHQVIAAERGVTAEAERKLAEVKQVLAIGGDRNPLTGLSRTYQPRDAEGEELPAESRKVQLTVAELLGHVQENLAKLFDVKLTKETGNTEAKADVKVDGRALLSDVPAPYLLFLESQITSLVSGLIERLPTLDPAEDWHGAAEDPGLPQDVYATAPKKTTRSSKVPMKQVLWEPSVEQIRAGLTGQAAQMRTWDADKIVGDWTMIKFSGELPVREAQEMRARAVKLLEAVKRAREEANRAEVTNRKAGEAVLGYIFTG